MNDITNVLKTASSSSVAPAVAATFMAGEEAVAGDSIERATREIIKIQPHLGPKALIAKLGAEGFDMQNEAALIAVARAAGVPAPQIPECVRRWGRTMATPVSEEPPANKPTQNGQDTSDELRKANKPQQSEAVQFLEWLRPGGPWPLTAIEPDGPTKTITAMSAKEVDEFVRRHNGKRNIYYSVNPTRTRMNKKAARTDIAQIEYALADLDPKDDETSDDAKERYLKQLDGDFEPKPTAIIDSGNGIQCLWRLQEPIKLSNPIKGPDGKMVFLLEDQAKIDDVEDRVEQIMLRLGSKAGTQNIDRILRLPGTTNLPNAKKRKAGRVNCPTKLLRFGGEVHPLDAFPKPKSDEDPKQKSSEAPKPESDESKTNEHASDKKNAADLGPFLTSLLHVEGAGAYSSRSELLFAFLTGALRKGVPHDVIVAACLDNRYRSHGIYEHCWENENRERGYVERQIVQAHEVVSKRTMEESAKAGALKTVNAADIKMQAVEWIWPGRFAVGKLGILAGMPDEGKGQILCFIAAAITNGGPWPCNEGNAPKGKVLLLTAEDDLADTVVPRLVAAGADLHNVEILQMVGGDGAGHSKKERMFNLVTDLDMLRRKLLEIGDVRMVMIDPITAYMGVKQVDSFKITDVRAVLGPVVQLAAELRVSFLAVMHFNKKTDVNNALLRISDSLAYGATARHVYCAINDEEHDRKLLVKAKNNLAKYNQQSLAYHFAEKKVGFDDELQKEIWAPFIEWEKNPVAITANEAMAAAATTSRGDGLKAAKAFLEAFLAEGPRPQKIAEAHAEQRGISRDQLKRARKELDSWSEREGFGKGGKWIWGLSGQIRPSEAQAELAGV
jgi:putative DNA primase/helicase